MFSTIKIHLAMFDAGLLSEEKLALWLRFHAWIREYRGLSGLRFISDP